ncbi:MAG: hypothetical protein LQ338_002326 [Usnochroma carphineum]|nr:MAG: hypothetical protein LQ338_002326 [Usnochroma carphineum]
MTLSASPPDLAQPTDIPDALPPHRSHDPASNLKRSDPFQFGSRYLLPDDDPFEFNAWDHVEPSAEGVRHFETRVAQQRAAPVLDFDRQRFNSDPARWWNRFYANNTSNFFKDRKWLKQEFPVLKEVTQKGAGTKVLLEIGAGAGNTCFPVLKDNANDELMVYACDFSPKAVDLIRESTAYDLHHVRAEVWDVASPSLPHGLDEGTVDVVLLIFIFSALHPTQWKQAVRNILRLLKPGGEVCFRDYGRGDLAQVRMKKGRYMEENFYIRGDGTRVYFFDKDELRNIWSGEIFQKETFDDPESKDDGPSGVGVAAQATDIEGDVVHEQSEAVDGCETLEFIKPIETWFEIEDLDVDRRLLINRQRQLRMYRCWMQGRFRKPNRSEATLGH